MSCRPELADPVSATMQRSQQTRFADAPEEEYHFMVERNGFVEESFFMWSLIPLVGVGQIDGMYSIVTEVTKQRYDQELVFSIDTTYTVGS
jgi:predicted secreted protein